MSQAELNGELFTLERFPPNAEEEALQAWEAADEYLLQQVNDVDGLTLIFNDSFGAPAAIAACRTMSAALLVASLARGCGEKMMALRVFRLIRDLKIAVAPALPAAQGFCGRWCKARRDRA